MISSDANDPYGAGERMLKRLGWARTRENFIRAIYNDPPETWDDEAEEQLPPDLRLACVPDTPFPDEDETRAGEG